MAVIVFGFLVVDKKDGFSSGAHTAVKMPEVKNVDN